MDMKRMYSVPNARNEREIRNPNVLIYQLVGVSYELIYHSRLFNIIYIMRTNINQGRIQSLAVMIVLLINNDQNPISYLIPYSRLNRSCNLNTLVSTTSYPLYGINAAISAIADKKEDLKVV